jgi:hypothetical protein
VRRWCVAVAAAIGVLATTVPGGVAAAESSVPGVSLDDLSPAFLAPKESVASVAAQAQSLAPAAEETAPPAASSGQAVADGEREGWTATSHWWINDDGGRSVESFTKPMFFKDEAGRWRDFDMHLEGASDGRALVPRRAPKDVARVAKRATAGSPLLTLRGEHGAIGVSYVGSLPLMFGLTGPGRRISRTRCRRGETSGSS